MTATETDPAPAPPEPAAEWVNLNDLPAAPPAETKSEPDAEKNDPPARRVGHIALGGAAGSVLGGVGLFTAFGPVGLAAGAAVAAGGLGLYGYHRYRRSAGPRPLRSRRERARRAGKLGSTGLGRKGKAPKLFGGGRGSKLGGKGGPKLGKGGKLLGGKGGKLGSGKGPKLSGKGGPKLGGKSGGKLLGGKAGKLGSGRSKGLGGKLGNGRKTAGAKLGSAGKSGGKLLGRGGKAGLGLGKRSGKAAKTRLGSAGRKAGAAALRTKAGRRAAGGLKAAKKALKSASTGTGRWSRFRQARRAARAKLGGKNWATRFLAAVGSWFVAGAAMVGLKRKTRKDAKAPTEKDAKRAEADPTATSGDSETPTGAVIPGTVISSTYETPAGTPAGDAPPSTTRSDMPQFPLAIAAQQVTAAAAAYKPQTMWDVDQDLEQAHTVPLAVAEAFKIYTMTLRNNYPLHPAIVEALGRAYIALGEVATAMQQTPGLFKQVHADDIRRKTAPRGDESKWNVH